MFSNFSNAFVLLGFTSSSSFHTHFLAFEEEKNYFKLNQVNTHNFFLSSTEKKASCCFLSKFKCSVFSYLHVAHVPVQWYQLFPPYTTHFSCTIVITLIESLLYNYMHHSDSDLNCSLFSLFFLSNIE